MKLKIFVVLFLIITFPLYTIAQPRFPSAYANFQKGICFVTWTSQGYSSKSSDESLKAISETGANCVQIVVTWYQETFDSVEIKKISERTPTDKSIKYVIKKAHALGMSVMLKPHIDLIKGEGNWRADIGFYEDADWEKWLENYKKFIIYYAKLAEQENVEIFCVGTELSYASTRTDMWKDAIIPSVRKVYDGKITYAANWDNYKNIKFWDSLDYAGIDAYFPLTAKTNPTKEELKEAWKGWVYEITEWQKKTDKPVVFTECGYSSSDLAANRPWEEVISGQANPVLQERCYRALFETFCEKPWFRGLYWWKWNTYKGSGGMNHSRFTPQNKPALKCVEIWYTQLIS